MAIGRRDDWLTDAQGRALAGAEVFYCTQPATTSPLPPTPLATIYSDMQSTVQAQPVITDGFGHAVAYLTANALYTVVYVHPLFGSPVVLKDQAVTIGSTLSLPVPVTPTPAPDGIIRDFVLPYAPGFPLDGQLYVSGSYVKYGIAYTITGADIVWIGAVPPQLGDELTYFGT
jgi:hypothetical protein